METIIAYLDEGKADLAFTYPKGLNPNHEFMPLFRPPPFALISNKDPMSRLDSVTIKELAEKPMVLLDLPQTRDYFVGLFQKAGVMPQIAHTTRSAEIARALVTGGFGYTILNIRPQSFQEDGANYRAVRIAGDLEVHWFGIATIANVRRPKIVENFLDNCSVLQRNGAFDSLSLTETN